MRAPISVLLVEDDEVEIMGFKRALEATGLIHTLTIAHDGVEALAAIREGAILLPPPDIIFLDLNLPRMSGLELLRRVRSEPRLRTTNVVVVTTSNMEEDRRSAVALEVNGYVVKSNYMGNFNGFSCEIGGYLCRATPIH